MSEHYTYDDGDRLTLFQRGDVNTSGNCSFTTLIGKGAGLTRSQTWILDGLGNWNTNGISGGPYETTEGRAHNKANEITDITTSGTINPTYDNNGNLTKDAHFLYYYDVENRLTKVADLSHTTIAEMSYDALGRRVRKVVTNTSDYNGDYHYQWNQDWQLMQVYTYASSTYTLKQNFVHAGSPTPWYSELGVGGGHAYIDDHIALYTAPLKRYFYHADAQYNTQMVTNDTPASAASYVYTPYGLIETITLPGSGSLGLSATNNAFIHQGLPYDAELSSYYNRNRQYMPALGRFAQRDPLVYADSPSLYQYLSANSLTRKDPFGTMCRRSNQEEHFVNPAAPAPRPGSPGPSNPSAPGEPPPSPPPIPSLSPAQQRCCTPVSVFWEDCRNWETVVSTIEFIVPCQREIDLCGVLSGSRRCYGSGTVETRTCYQHLEIYYSQVSGEACFGVKCPKKYEGSDTIIEYRNAQITGNITCGNCQ